MSYLTRSFSVVEAPGKIFLYNPEDMSSLGIRKAKPKSPLHPIKTHKAQVQITNGKGKIYAYMIRKGYKDGFLMVIRERKERPQIEVKISSYEELRTKEVIEGVSFNDFRSLKPIQI